MKITVTINKTFSKHAVLCLALSLQPLQLDMLVLVVMVKWMLCFLFDTIHNSTYIVKIGVNFSYV